MTMFYIYRHQQQQQKKRNYTLVMSDAYGFADVNMTSIHLLVCAYDGKKETRLTSITLEMNTDQIRHYHDLFKKI
jgi:hypothetical protein